MVDRHQRCEDVDQWVAVKVMTEIDYVAAANRAAMSMVLVK